MKTGAVRKVFEDLDITSLCARLAIACILFAGSMLPANADPDVVVHLPLDDGIGTTASDVSGLHNDGTLRDGATFDADTGNGSAYSVRLDGVNDYVELGALDVGGVGLTIAGWFKADSLDGNYHEGRLVSKASGTAANDHVFMLSTIRVGSAVRLRGRIRVGGLTTTLIASSGNLRSGEWRHAALTYDGSTLRLYLDAIQVGSTPVSGLIDTDPSLPIAVGGQPPGAGARYFFGRLDDVRILQRSLSPAELAEIVFGNPAPTADFTATPQSGQVPLNVTFDASGSTDYDGTIVDYFWGFGDGAIGSGITTSHTYSSVGEYTATLTVTDNDSNTDATSRVISVAEPGNLAPTASFSVTPQSGEAPLTVNVNGGTSSDSDGSIASYLWNFGDGTSGSGATASHTYVAAGTYALTLTVTDDDGAVSTASQVITVGEPVNVAPTASFTATPTSGVAPLNVSVDGSGSTDGDGSIASYAWSFGDGTSGSGATASHTYVAAGTYTLTLTVTDDDGAVSTGSQMITVGEPVNVAIFSDDFNATALDPRWVFENPVGDGSFALIGAGTADARLLLNVPAGTDHDVWTAGNRSVRVMQPAQNVNFEIEAKFESTPVAQYQMQGILIEQDANDFLRIEFYSNGSGVWLFAARFVEGAPTIILNQAIATGSALYLRVTRVGETWTPKYSYDGIGWASAQSFSHTLAVSRVGVYGGNAGNKPAFVAAVDYFFNTASPIVPEDTPGNIGPTASFSVTPLSGDAPLTVAVDASASADADGTIESYMWNFGDGTSGNGASASHTYEATGNYTVTLTVTDDDGAVGTATRTVSVTTPGNDAPTASFLATPLSGPAPLNVALDASASTDVDGSIASYFWDFGDGTSGSGITSSHTYTVAGSYTITLTVTDDDGASGTTSRTVAVSFRGSNTPPVIDVWYGPNQTFGTFGLSQRWVNVLGNVSDPDGVASLSFTLNGGVAQSLSMGPDDRRLAEPGDFIVEIDFAALDPGQNQIMISATDNLGAISTSNVTVNFSANGVAVSPYVVDWSSVSDIQEVVQIVDGKWVQVADGVRTAQVDYDRLIAVGDFGASNFEITVPITIHGFESSPGPISGPQGVGLILRWTGHTNFPVVCPQPRCGWLPSGPIAWWRDGKLSLEDGGVDPSVFLNLGVRYMWKMRVIDTAAGNTRYSLKVWQETASEPAEWNIEATREGEENGTGAALLIAHHADVTFGDISLVPLEDPRPGEDLSGIVSDDFSSATLDPRWTFENPVGDGAYDLIGNGTVDARLLLSVPQGTDHDAWTGGNRSVRVMQSAQDENLGLEVKFETLPTQRFQTQGLLIEQDEDNFLRVDFNSDGSRLFLFAARLKNGAATTFVSEPIAPGSPIYLRVLRDGDIWTPKYSYDGVSWQNARSFTNVLAVSKVGVFAGNAGLNPAFTAAIDYLFNASSPIFPEDSPRCLEGERFDVAVGIIGDGAVTLAPMKASYECGDQVALTANAGLGSEFIRWIGTSSGTENPINLTVNADVAMTAEFAVDSAAPVISGLAVVRGQTSATVSFTTDELSASRVRYGVTTALEIGEVVESIPTADHSLTLEGLTPQTIYFAQVEVTDLAGNTAASEVISFTTLAVGGGPSYPVSDEFDGGTIDFGIWTFDNPLGTGMANVASAQLSLAIPSGVSHDVWSTGINAPRLMQAADNGDFVIELKFDSVPQLQYQLQGLLIEQDGGNLVRFDYYSDGTSIRLFAASFVNGSPTVRFNQSIAPLSLAAPMFLRVTRTGSLWLQQYSFDGTTWQTGGSFTHSLTVSRAGPFVGNAGGNPPAFTALVNYFRVSL